MTLAEFLLARIAEDEADARAAIEPESTRTLFDGRQVTDVDEGVWDAGAEGYDECRVEGTFMVIYDEGGHSRAHALHIARHDPARVLAECEAKRQIVDLHFGPSYLPRVDGAGDDLVCECGAPYPCPTLRHLASVYAGHPDYRDEWRL